MVTRTSAQSDLGPSPLTTVQWLICGHCRDRLRVRFLRAPDGAAVRRTGARQPAGRAGDQPGRQRLGRHPLLCSGARGRRLRSARRLPDRPARPPPRARVEHSALRGLRVCRGLLDLGPVAALLALLHVRRRLRRVRRRCGVAVGALSESKTARNASSATRRPSDRSAACS